MNISQRLRTCARHTGLDAVIELLQEAADEIDALQARAQVQGEPVGFTYQAEIEYANSTGGNGSFWHAPPDFDDESVPLYTHPAANVPEFSRIAKRKLDELQKQGFGITGYAIQRGTQHGFITNAGFVGWWRSDEAPSVPADVVRVPLQVLKDASEALGNFVSDHGWGDADMQAMDNLDAYIARHEANRAAMLAT